jgi:hypothetical protein
LAFKATLLPAQNVVEPPGVMVAEGIELTVIVTVLEVAGEPVAQPSEEVITTDT